MNDLHLPHPHLPHPRKPSRHDVALALVAAVLSAALSVGAPLLANHFATPVHAAPDGLPPASAWTQTGVASVQYIDPEPGVRCYAILASMSCVLRTVSP